MENSRSRAGSSGQTEYSAREWHCCLWSAKISCPAASERPTAREGACVWVRVYHCRIGMAMRQGEHAGGLWDDSAGLGAGGEGATAGQGA